MGLRGKQPTGSGQYNFCINLYKYEIEKIKDLAKKENKNPSTWCAEKMVKWFTEKKFEAPKLIERDKDLKDSKPHQFVCVKELFLLMKKAAELNDMSLTSFFVGVILG